MRRWKLLVLAGLAVVLGAAARGLWLPSANTIFIEENVKHIRAGIPRYEVEAIVGWRGTVVPLPRWSQFPPGSINVHWEDDELELDVYFDSRGRVLRRGPLAIIEHPDDPCEAILWRAKRQWHRWFPE